MRVEMVEKLPKRRLTSRKRSPKAPGNHALQNFLTAVKNEEPRFSVKSSYSGSVAGAGGTGGAFSGDFIITLRSSKDARNRAMHFTLVEKLTELFRNAGSSATLAVTLCLKNPGAGGRKKSGLEIRLRLEALGDSAEQAEMRWGLGLAHVQQALLFTSRGMQ